MENLYLNSMILRNLGHNKANYRDHLGAPPMSDADDVAFAIAEKLLQKEVDRKMWDFHNQLEKRRAVHSNDHHLKKLHAQIFTAGIMVPETFTYKHKSDWMLDLFDMSSEEFNGIEDAFRSFMKDVEWEDE